MHECPGLEPGAAARLAGLLAAEPWMLRALDAVAVSGLPDAWIGAGVIRDLVWGQYHRGFDPAAIKDVDVAYFDPADLTMERDLTAQETLGRLADLPWEATNQAAVHVWYHQYFGGAPVESFASVHDAVATWPETATCVAVRQRPDGMDSQTCSTASGGSIRSGSRQRSRKRAWRGSAFGSGGRGCGWCRLGDDPVPAVLAGTSAFRWTRADRP
jgi:hypothetical protein